jgi:hypothetical protein
MTIKKSLSNSLCFPPLNQSVLASLLCMYLFVCGGCEDAKVTRPYALVIVVGATPTLTPVLS